ncbi:hypothetical protein EF384_02995 [Aerococcus agrisoli]|uniref:Uncharacterized protein n=1 Tax=Aerococcus agrisoli TaxID=2487350 RepID=A0A3N4GK89_9LACT|nr:hypothetical protein [Aerococcus agrisoli]RPA60996.1 hypothetical protein EF384_02995 [Aerococcus agrisoli]
MRDFFEKNKKRIVSWLVVFYLMVFGFGTLLIDEHTSVSLVALAILLFAILLFIYIQITHKKFKMIILPSIIAFLSASTMKGFIGNIIFDQYVNVIVVLTILLTSIVVVLVAEKELKKSKQ